MLSLATFMFGVSAAITNVAGAALQPLLEPRQNGFMVQNWANDFADVDFENGNGGAFSATWKNGPGGNFVVGKGYRPARDM
jgi:endo-1,4-beta-xylanase